MSEYIDKELLNEKFPSNSRKNKTEIDLRPEGKQIEKIVTGTVKQQKRGFMKKLAGIFLEDDTKSVGSYIFHDVLIPAAKSMISDMVGGGIEMLLFGEKRGSRTRREGGRSYTSYGSFYQANDRDRNRDRDKPRSERDMSNVGRARHDFDEIVVESRGEAEMVLSHLVDLTMDYGQATVSDLYQLVGITAAYTDDKFGWYDLRSDEAYISRQRNGGYLINLPKTRLLE